MVNKMQGDGDGYQFVRLRNEDGYQFSECGMGRRCYGCCGRSHGQPMEVPPPTLDLVVRTRTVSSLPVSSSLFECLCEPMYRLTVH